jgi:hypothetical protein
MKRFLSSPNAPAQKNEEVHEEWHVELGLNNSRA